MRKNAHLLPAPPQLAGALYRGWLGTVSLLLAEERKSMLAWVAALDFARAIAWVRLVAVAFAALDLALEWNDYPSGHRQWAIVLTATLALGAVSFFALDCHPRVRHSRVVGLAALCFDVAVVSGYTVLLAYDIGTPVRQALLLPVLEGALRFGFAGGCIVPFALLPALVGFEWRQAFELDLHPFNAGHVLFPFGLAILVGLLVALLRRQASQASQTRA